MKQSLSFCAECQQELTFTHSGGPCLSCKLCCDCCTCRTDDFKIMQQEVRAFYGGDFIDMIVGDDPFTIAITSDITSSADMTLLYRTLVKISIWPCVMEDDEIVFDPATGKLTPETVQRVEVYLRLNEAVRRLDEERSWH